FPDSLAQQTLKNNGKDTLYVTGGRAKGMTVQSRPDLPWLVTGYTYVDTAAQLKPRPGSVFVFNYYGGMSFENFGTLNAVGEPTKYIVFKPGVGASYFYGLGFDNP